MRKRARTLFLYLYLFAVPCFSVEASGPADPVQAPTVIQPIDASRIRVNGKPVRIAKVRAADTGRTYPITLSWSPDDTVLVIQSCKPYRDDDGQPWAHSRDRTRADNILYQVDDVMRWVDPLNTIHHRVTKVDTRTGDVSRLGDLPRWARDYWALKSAMVSQGQSLEIVTRADSKYGIPGFHEYVIGDHVVGRFWQDSHASRLAVAPGRDMRSHQRVNADAPGELLGYSTEKPSLWHVLYAGLTYSWAPPGGEAIVFCSDRRVKLLDSEGKTRRLLRSNMFLPAWSNDGSKIAFVEVPMLTEDWFIRTVELRGIERRAVPPTAK